ncbi:hypothetical protein HO173_003264 [Letharia columbiana]|uniref:Deacetylase sirtuin-type domain-containing protein n=1 Tax=Letharia columbiana TaxID=112416 RepID=A0A8H6G1K7_9LECA|nr:uncharacterized protein HO173_003264 [Letharia columbiana]KAF6238757.1 hypothetical protein HO173_003264 [Letharia columbiana]
MQLANPVSSKQSWKIEASGESKTGLSATNGADAFNASVYANDAATSAYHAMVRALDKASKRARRTPFHEFLSLLGGPDRRLMRLYTQNIDGLEVALPFLGINAPLARRGPWPPTIQLHGTLKHMYCQQCKEI